MADTYLNSLAPTEQINSWAEWTNKHGPNTINPEIFYSKILLDTIRIDGEQYKYYRLADSMPIQEKADKLSIRRWAPQQAHTVPLVEGVPPKSDKGSVEKYEIAANQYGRYMEFTDKVDFAVVDPVIVHYTREYSLVAIETLDMLARETLFSVAQKFYAGEAANFEELRIGDVPNMVDLRLIVLSLKRALVKPRNGNNYHVIASPEFFYDMVEDPTVEKYMKINNTTKSLYADSELFPLFGLEFYETLVCPTSNEFIKDGELAKRMYRLNAAGTDYEYMTWKESDTGASGQGPGGVYVETVDGYVKDTRTGQDASYIPHQKIWDYEAWNTDNAGGGNDWSEFKVQHVLVVGKDALTRTGIQGEDQTKVYVKQKGSAGVLDPIDQRQSIGFKINSVGFGSTRLEAIVDYICVPTNINPV